MAKMTSRLKMPKPDKKVVLVIDDDPMVRKLLKKIAKSLDLLIVEAQDGKDALQFLIETIPLFGLPDLIMVDLYMPNMDGISFCKTIKQDFSFPSDKIIIISAVSQKEDLKKINQLEEINLIIKPFSIEEVRQMIKSKLEVSSGSNALVSEIPIPKKEMSFSNDLIDLSKNQITIPPSINNNPETQSREIQTKDLSSNKVFIKEDLTKFIEKLYSLNGQIFSENPNSAEETQREITEHFHLGSSYFEMGLFDDAIEELLQAVNIAETFHLYDIKFQSCILLAECFLYKESFENSIMWLNNALEPMINQQPTALNLLYELGQIYQKIEKPKEALGIH